MNTLKSSINEDYQLGLLHFVHLLINVDGRIDDREMEAIQSIKREEKISDKLFQDFSRSISTMKEHEIYNHGVELLNKCNEEEKICAFVHLLRLAEADSSINVKEVRLLLYAVKITKVDFEDILMSARLTPSSEKEED